MLGFTWRNAIVLRFTWCLVTIPVRLHGSLILVPDLHGGSTERPYGPMKQLVYNFYKVHSVVYMHAHYFLKLVYMGLHAA